MLEGEPEIAEKIAESLRQETYHLFRNDCLTKSLRLRRECRKIGLKAYLIWCALGLRRVRFPLLGEITVPYCTHFWVEVQSQRLETSRPLGSRGLFGIVPSRIRPVLTIRF